MKQMILHKVPKYGIFILVSAVLLFSLLLRVSSLRNNTPFWVDEFSTGTSARMIQEYGPRVFWERPAWLESNNTFTYVLTALSFDMFGQSEQAARVPSILFGSLVVVAVYLLGRRLHSDVAGIIAAAFTATSYFQIVWSLQARSYMLLQLLILLTVWWGIRMMKSDVRPKDIGVLLVLFIFGITTHFMYFFCAVSVTLGIVFSHRDRLTTFAVSRWYLVLVGLILSGVVLWQIGLINSFLVYINSSFFLSNNLWYYHPFLWREYGLVIFTAILGYALAAKSLGRPLGVIALHLVLQLVFVTFFFGHHMSKYLLPIFPYFFIGMGIFVYEVSKVIVQGIGEISLFKKKIVSTGLMVSCIAFGMAFFIIAQGHKFVLKPKAYYSINHDFREIANIDYTQIYAIIKKGISASKKGEVAMIETWPGRVYWYLGEAYEPFYLFRWENEEGLSNGHSKKTIYTLNEEGEKTLSPKLLFVGEVDDLLLAMQKHPKGYMFIDDDTLPRDVIDYANENLKKELFLDHYPLDDNPYSIWPATLYSWGFE